MVPNDFFGVLADLDKFEGILAGNIKGAFFHGDGIEAELERSVQVNLRRRHFGEFEIPELEVAGVIDANLVHGAFELVVVENKAKGDFRVKDTGGKIVFLVGVVEEYRNGVIDQVVLLLVDSFPFDLGKWGGVVSQSHGVKALQGFVPKVLKKIMSLEMSERRLLLRMPGIDCPMKRGAGDGVWVAVRFGDV